MLGRGTDGDASFGALRGVFSYSVDERRPEIRLLGPKIGHVVAAEERLPPRHETRAMPFDHRGVAPERPAQIPVLPLDDPLRAADLVRDEGAVDRVGRIPFAWDEPAREQTPEPEAHEQVVLQADEESRLARIPLAPCAAT